MDVLARRGYLETSENPNARLDYVVSLSGTIAGLCRIDIRYIPDKAVLTSRALTAYLAALEAQPWTHLEELAAAVLGDLNNELVARWVQVTVSGIEADLTHRVTLEDRQPKWDNPALLSRIGAA